MVVVAFIACRVRGVTVMGASGDGGSHFSFQEFMGGHMAEVLNKISCEFQMPVYPTGSPCVCACVRVCVCTCVRVCVCACVRVGV